METDVKMKEYVYKARNLRNSDLEETRKDSLLEPAEEAKPWQHLDFRLLDRSSQKE
jgi:hypothetical protein